MAVKFTKLNDAYIKVEGPAGFEQELADMMTFDVPGAKYMPAFRTGFWDGKIRLYNRRDRQIYAGLYERITAYCDKEGYEYEPLESMMATDFATIDAERFAASLNLPFEPRDYQIEAFVACIRNQRQVILLPTGSGKSLTVYIIARFLNHIGKRVLIIVPNLNLIHQIDSDFTSYNLQEEVALIFGGQQKKTDAKITISTWQSLHKVSKEWFRQFGGVIVDEAHGAKASAITKLLTKMEHCPYRIGFTGTLDGADSNEMTIEGLLGPIKVVRTTKELIDQKHLASLQIKCVILRHGPDTVRAARQVDYQSEIDLLTTDPKRADFLNRLILSLKTTTLVIFHRIAHGQQIYDLLKQSTDRPVYLIHGLVKGEERERIRHIVEQQPNAVIIGSTGTVSTGINIPSLRNIIFASPSKARIKIIQSIGRTLRKTDTKLEATLIDVADDLSSGSWRNYTLNHYVERLKLYVSEQHKFKQYKVKL